MSIEKINTPLHLHASQGSLEEVRAFLQEYPGFINLQSKTQSQTAIIWSVMLEKDCDEQVKSNKLEVSTYLLNQGCDPNIVDDRGMNALHNAVESHNFPAVELLVNSGKIIDINAKSKFGFTPLAKAAIAKDYAICEFLLSRADRLGIDINLASNDGSTPISAAAYPDNSTSEAEREELFKLFIDHGADHTIKYRMTNGKMRAPLDDFSEEVQARLVAYIDEKRPNQGNPSQIKESEKKVKKPEPQNDLISNITGFLSGLCNGMFYDEGAVWTEKIDTKPKQQPDNWSEAFSINNSDAPSGLRKRHTATNTNNVAQKAY